MFVFYDIEVLKHDWFVVFKDGKTYKVIHNDIHMLKTYLDSIYSNKILVGFNNHHYDDVVLACMLSGKLSPQEATRLIIEERKHLQLKIKHLSLDVTQELPMNVSLKSSQANLGLKVFESSVDLMKQDELSLKEITEIIKYCKNDVDDTELLFYKRDDYFSAKFEIVKEFKLDPKDIRLTRAMLASRVLKCVPISLPRDTFNLKYDPNIDWKMIPPEVETFFTRVTNDYKAGTPEETIVKRKVSCKLDGVNHSVGFGGLHGAISKYKGEGIFLNIDVASYYPNLIINNNFMSRKVSNPKDYATLLSTRLKLKDKGNPKEYIYKILLNATFGAMHYRFNPLYDPRQMYNVTVNGQLILISLINELRGYGKLIQSNTDGIILKLASETEKKNVIGLVEEFGSRFNLTFDFTDIKKIIQRDVNNYIIQTADDKLKTKGRFAKWQGSGFEMNNLTIIDRALVNYFIHNIPTERTIIDCYQNNDLLPFQIVAKYGATFDGMYQEVGEELKTEYVELQRVNRVFAGLDKTQRGIYKKKAGAYSKIPTTSEYNYVHNEDISLIDKSKIDLNYYIDMCKREVNTLTDMRKKKDSNV